MPIREFLRGGYLRLEDVTIVMRHSRPLFTVTPRLASLEAEVSAEVSREMARERLQTPADVVKTVRKRTRGV